MRVEQDLKPSSATPPSPAPSTGITAEPQSGPVRPGESTKSTLRAQTKDLKPTSAPAPQPPLILGSHLDNLGDLD